MKKVGFIAFVMLLLGCDTYDENVKHKRKHEIKNSPISETLDSSEGNIQQNDKVILPQSKYPYTPDFEVKELMKIDSSDFEAILRQEDPVEAYYFIDTISKKSNYSNLLVCLESLDSDHINHITSLFITDSNNNIVESKRVSYLYSDPNCIVEGQVTFLNDTMFDLSIKLDCEYYEPDLIGNEYEKLETIEHYIIRDSIISLISTDTVSHK